MADQYLKPQIPLKDLNSEDYFYPLTTHDQVIVTQSRLSAFMNESNNNLLNLTNIGAITSTGKFNLNGDLEIPNNHSFIGILGSNSSTDYTNVGGLTWFNLNGTAGAAANVNDTPTSAWWYIIRNRHTNTGNNYYTDLAIPFNSPSIYYKRVTGNYGSESIQGNKWVKVLDEDNYSSTIKTFTNTITGDILSAWHLLAGRPSNTTNFRTYFEIIDNLHHDNPARTDSEMSYNRFFASNSDQTTYGPDTLNLPVVDQHILSFGIDNNVNYSRHIALDIRTNKMFLGGRVNKTWQAWSEIIVHNLAQTITGVKTFTTNIIFNVNADLGIIQSYYNETKYNILRHHNNGNVSLSAESAGLYLGYQNTTFINFLNGRARLQDGCLHLHPNNGNYREGIRIHAQGSWSDIVLCGNDLTADTGTSANTWFIGNNNGTFNIVRNGCSTGTAYFRCVNNKWYANTTSGSEQLNVGGWVGTVGNTGWYNITHGGGWYMQDTTYIRNYNSKHVYITGRLGVDCELRLWRNTRQITRDSRSVSWIGGRDSALIRESNASGYHSIACIKTGNGTWNIGNYNTSGWTNYLLFSYTTDANYNAGTNNVINIRMRDNGVVESAMWNDYAEYRESQEYKPGTCVQENDNGILTISDKRLIPGAGIISDTYGYVEGETEKAKTPIAVSGRVLAYTYQDRKKYHAGMSVCSAPNGTIDIMTREEIQKYPDAIIGIVSEIPEYKTWGTDDKILIDNRIWIKVRY